MVYKTLYYLNIHYLSKLNSVFLFFVHSGFTTFSYLLLLKNAKPGVMSTKRWTKKLQTLVENNQLDIE